MRGFWSVMRSTSSTRIKLHAFTDQKSVKEMHEITCLRNWKSKEEILLKRLATLPTAALSLDTKKGLARHTARGINNQG
jgi:hypothetical protein